ncbi:MAG: ABC transporter substrate-binding protein, partial [Halobacteriaceae archaeon]
MSQDSRGEDRRQFLKLAGSAAVATTLAGCSGDGGGEGDQDTTTTAGDGEDQTATTTAASGDGGGEPTVLTYARGSKSTTLDQQSSTNGENSKVVRQLFDTMVMLKPGTFTITEGLATGWEFEGTTLTFTLREGVKFHNGEEFTADDVIAT